VDRHDVDGSSALDPRSYARPRSGSSSYSYPSKKGLRATRAEVREAIQSAPPQAVAEFSADLSLEELASCYSRVTGRPVEKVTGRQRNFLAAIWRVHGDDLEPLLRTLYAEGGENNLLLRARTHQPRSTSLRVIEALPAPQRPAQGSTPDDSWLENAAGRAAKATWGPLVLDTEKYHADLERLRGGSTPMERTSGHDSDGAS